MTTYAADYEHAWAAGFFDGEGSTFTTARREKRYLRLTVSQIHREPLDRLSAVFGGSVSGPHPKGQSRHPLYAWQAGRFVVVRAALRAMWPYLGTEKKRQAIRAWRQLGYPRLQELRNPDRYWSRTA